MEIFNWLKKKFRKNIENYNGYNLKTYTTGYWGEYYTKNGKKEGLNKTYYPSGALSSEWNYKNGVEDGYMKSYYKNGQLKTEMNFKNGLKDGERKEYFKNGKIFGITQFKNNEYIRSKNYYLDGSFVPRELTISDKHFKGEFRIFIDGKLEGQN